MTLTIQRPLSRWHLAVVSNIAARIWSPHILSRSGSKTGKIGESQKSWERRHPVLHKYPLSLWETSLGSVEMCQFQALPPRDSNWCVSLCYLWNFRRIVLLMMDDNDAKSSKQNQHRFDVFSMLSTTASMYFMDHQQIIQSSIHQDII